MRQVYFDNAATTRVRPEVAELMTKVMTEDYGNPSSRHIYGVNAEKYIKTAAEQIAATLKVKPQEIIFNSGGTEGNNNVLIGTALQRKGLGKHIISTNIEHAAVYNPLIFLESMGYEVTFIGVDSKGHIDMDALSEGFEYSIDEHNTVLLTKNGASMIYADCPDKECINMGTKRNGSIICLPNRVEIKIVSDEEDDVDAYTK